ncbi:MAG TPA: DNA internalization-related competence protein ComEC/Rec2 [Telluria sp.]|nr:DNA internalization-related competence protein ComEC/Rec2 [Telluria sp.]
MRSAILFFAAGAACLQTAAALPPFGVVLILASVSAACVFASRIRWRALRLVCGGAGAFTAGYAWAAMLAASALSADLPRELEGRDLHVVGVIDSLPFEFEGGVRFNFQVESVERGFKVPPRIALAWYGARELVAPGQRWRLNLRLQRPHGNANPYGFDYEEWLLEQGLRATGYVRPGPNALLDGHVFGIGYEIERLRAWLRARIRAALPDAPYAGVIVALVIGDQRAIAQSDWQIFNRTGISHLVSISGLHITMVAGMCAALVAALWRRSFFTDAQLPLLLPAQKAAALAGALAALVYVLLAGFGIPAQRTLYMLAVVAAASWSGRSVGVTHILCAALFLVVLLDPWAVLAPGFWLSFGAVGAILFAGTGRFEPALRGWRPMLSVAARMQAAVTLGLVPLTMLLFGQFSLASPVANAVAIPLVSFIVTPLALLGSVAPPGLSDWLLAAAHACMVGLAGFLQMLSVQPWAVWSAPRPDWPMFLVASGGVAWLLAPRGWPLRWLGLMALLPMLAASASRPEAGRVHVVAFDVGQGMAVLLETPGGHRLLYDTGPSFGPASDAGGRVIAPYLKARGIDTLDAIVVSHSDTDHVGGALTLLDSVRVGWVLSSLPRAHPVARRAARHVRCAAGQEWEWDGVRFTVLHPRADSYDDRSLRPNARGCVLRVEVNGHAMLLPGDIEAPQEAALVEQGALLRAEVLLAPHHGSGTSSTPDFLRAVAPQTALFQVGYRNRYHHPKPAVFARYADFGIARWRTDEAGALEFDLGDALDVHSYRMEHARYWYGR